MKIRTDFVTNSSSSSYCVSFAVEFADKNTATLDLWPSYEDGSGSVNVPITRSVDQLAFEILSCQGVSQLKRLLIDSLDISSLFEDEYVWIDINALKRMAPEDELGREVLKKVRKFQSKFSDISDVDQIESVSIKEYFTGWGEFAGEGVDLFLEKAMENIRAIRDAEAIKHCLAGKLDEDELAIILDQIENFSICQFDANIITTVYFGNGKMKKEYSFDAQ